MVTSLSVEQARAALLAANSEAYDPRYFLAVRREGGWLFRWNPQAGEVPIGTSPWVVADNGRAQAVGFTETSVDLLARLNGPQRSP